ncbi:MULTISPECIES: ribokinase [unclassified Bacillus (in: firmicutes)]|uniref:ribokinase n=1 Tax=unclassified Bacillus (in: firmicutes) TaxID=185979 RepID=UPI000B864B51|nr:MULTISPECIES: ribokinase [unclassified Bacillus (in: firmicutes)]
MKKIAVIGSINMDYFIETDVFPNVGETVLAKKSFTALGGKGANQAVAAGRLGADVTLFGSIGDDDAGDIFKKKMEKEFVDISFVQSVKNIATGSAFIELSKSENRILVVPGANQCTDREYVERMFNEMIKHDIFVFQLETPVSMLEYLVPKLADHGKIIVLNPAPAQTIQAELLEKITYVTPNEHEFKVVMNSVDKMEDLLFTHPNQLLITKGTAGVFYSDGQKIVCVPALKVEAVDTTGAGDTFSGAFAAALAEGKELRESIQFANIAAGLSVKKKGAQAGMPTREEVLQFYASS